MIILVQTFISGLGIDVHFLIFLAFFQLGTDNLDVATVTRPEAEKRCWGDALKKLGRYDRQ